MKATRALAKSQKSNFNFYKNIIPAFAVFAMVVSLFGSALKASADTVVWPTNWTTPSQCTTDPTNDENPSQIDLVGDAGNPAVGFAADSSFMYFRERVGGNPGTPASLDQSAWVVLFQTTKPQYQYLGSVNGKDDKVQLWQNSSPAGTVDFSPLMNDPADTMLHEIASSGNVRVTSLGGGVYFLDWAMPLSWFTGTGININTTKFFATSADANNFNKDHLNCYNTLADLAVTKTVNNQTANEGTSLQYTVTVTNTGPDVASSTVVSDLVPSNVTFVSATPSVGSYNSTSGQWTIGNLAVNASATLTINVTVKNGTAGQTAVNTATASSATTDFNPGNNTATASTTITSAPPTTGTLTVVKQVTNDNGGSATPASFSIHVKNGSDVTGSPMPGSSTGTVYTLVGGAYTVSEDANSGYNSDFSGCGNSGSVTVVNGQNTSCTIVNNDKPASLTVIKNVVNDNGGNAVAGDFTMAVTATNASQTSFAGSESGTTITLNAGSYSVDESIVVSGYQKTLGQDCSGTIANGQSKTCTITNNDIQPRLTVVKHVENGDNETPLTADLFTMTVTGGSTSVNNFSGSESGVLLNVDAGIYTVDEIRVENYEPSFVNCNQLGVVTLSIGDNVTCTITNTFHRPPPKLGHITVIKNVVNDNGGTKSAGDFQMNVSATNADKTSFAGSSDGVVVTAEVGQFDITEVENSGYSASYSGCSGTLAENDELTCTITNDDIAPKLTVTKVVVNREGGTATSGDFTLLVTNQTASTTVTSGQEASFSAGDYVVSEQDGPSGYTGVFSGQCDAQGNISMELAGVYSCTLTNTYSSQSADLEIVKTDDAQGNMFERGQTVTYTVVVTNHGSDLAKGVTVSDLLPAGLTVISTSTTAGTFDVTTGNWDIGNLSNGASATLTVVVTVDQNAAGDVTNTATVSSTVPDPVPGNNSSSVTDAVNIPTLTLTKTGDGNGVVTGSVNGATSTNFCELNECRQSDEKQSFVETYASGTTITLTALPDSTSNFDGTWTSGPCNGSNNPVCSFVMTGPVTVNAHFGINPPAGCTSNCGGGGSSSGGSGIPVPPSQGQILGTSTTPSITMPVIVPQVLGATLPRTGTPIAEALVLLVTSGVGSAYILRKRKV